MHFSSCQIRFTTCPGRELECELSRTTCRNSPGSSNCPAGVPRWLSVGCPEDILVHRMYIPGNFRKQVSLRAHCSYHRPSEVIKMELGEAFLCLPLRAGFGGDVGAWAATFLSNTYGGALDTLLMCSNCLHVTLLTGTLGTFKFLIFHTSHLKHQNQKIYLVHKHSLNSKAFLKLKLNRNLTSLDTVVYQTQINRNKIKDIVIFFKKKLIIKSTNCPQILQQ